MNRIREIREARGLSVAQLAELVGTSQPQMTRLERGERRLTEDWMRRIATALKCSPMDLIVLEELREDAVPYEPGPAEAWARALASRALAPFQVKSNVLELAGIEPGAVILIDMSQAAVDAVKTGDIVVVQVYDTRDLMKATTIVRQFVAPSLLVTNRRGTNLAFNMQGEAFEAHIKGVRVPDTA